MELDVNSLDDAREAWRSGHRDELHRASFSGVTLGARLEAACWAATEGDDVRTLLQDWSVLVPIREALTVLTTATDLPRRQDHDAPEMELRRCPSRDELASTEVGFEWRYFLDRLRRSLATRLKMQPPKAHALAAAFGEMVDNVVEHAGLGNAPSAVVTYEVSDQHFGLAVADLGRGVLASLRENPLHESLSTDADALIAAVTRGASRRSGANGTGFAQLLRALADMEGHWFFRSGGARLRFDGRGTSNRVIAPSNSPPMLGFQLSVTARPQESSW